MDSWQPDIAEFPNAIGRRPSVSSTEHTTESMTDHAMPDTKPVNDASDPDTCRICRGEGTADEPLFYPCKCSGSIKYVHQDCLMEWLSHSQKKHCELCKTPFRFTKLYSPDMPKRLPFYIFMTHMTKYLFRNVLVWLRALLVISVWLGWLPYLMRSVWSFLFWISDEGLGPSPTPSFDGWDGTKSSFTITGTTTCASTPLLAATTTAAGIGDVVERLPVSVLLKAISKPLNASPPYWLTRVLGLTEKSVPGAKELLNATHVDQIVLSQTLSRPSSLLSEVALLKNFTRHPAINRTIIAVLEGQLITLLVIACFILIILVRDYVVQQQPEINMRAAFAAAENEAPPLVGPMNNPAPRDQEMGPVHNEDADEDEDEDVDSDDDSVLAHDGEHDAAELARAREALALQIDPYVRPIADFRRRATRRDVESGPESGQEDHHRIGSLSHVGDAGGVTESSHLIHTGNNAVRAVLSNNLDGSIEGTVMEYSRIYREAGGDREKILQIIRDEGLEDRMQYWIHLTTAMADSDSLLDMENRIASAAPTPSERRSSRPPTRPDSSKADRTSSDISSWTWADMDDLGDAASQGSKDKGKGKAVDVPANRKVGFGWGGEFGDASHSPNSDDDRDGYDYAQSSLLSAPTRPRSVSDGPQAPKPINILANNNWSFSDLPPDAPGVARGTASELPSSSYVTSAFEPTPSSSTAPRRNSGPIEIPNTRMSSIAENRTDDSTGTPDSTDDGMGEDADVLVEQIHDAQPVGNAERRPGGLVERVTDFMWRDVEAGPVDDLEPEEAVDIFGDNQNAPFFDNDREIDGEEAEMAPDVVEAAVAAGLDPEAVEDAEDFEGIMELIGMRGPVAGLFQNAIFCAFLVSISIFLCVFVPYNVGRVFVWIVANPARLLRIVFSASKFVQDGVLLVVGYTSAFTFNLLEAFRLLFRVEYGKQLMHTLRTDAKQVASGALDRILTSFMSEMPLISVSEVRNFSAISHEALLTLKNDIRFALSSLGRAVLFVFGGDYLSKLATAKGFISVAAPAVFQFLKAVPGIATQPGSWVINLNLSEAPSSANPGLSYWDANDRAWAIFAGYVSLCVTAGLYLARGTPLSTGQTAQEWEASIIDGLNQASGVMKVILIISIEMLIFPLYCGLLLDFALLPLFEGTSIKSRLLFTYNYPLTSIFVHWFVGTGYMFHFALFVSMCRKIMRKGVLYFIRDPDDPEFHPVRDVLERNVATQLRKILFSAFVYGALVVVCLGGVVWGLSLALPNVLPIHYSSNEPVLEFPIDLLFYNFLMPLAVKFFKPSDGLHAMYTWWFRTCARTLRLTWFLFGERRIDEEGTLALRGDSPHQNSPWWYRVFLEVDSENEVVPKTWQDTFKGGRAKPASQILSEEEMVIGNVKKMRLVESGQLIPNGRFVRSPASDQVKIPKGQSVFLDVSELNARRDGKLDLPESDLYSGGHYQFVYVPPWFRARIFLFILFIWIFAAVTGVGFTIVPLVFGRRMFKILIPAHIRTNDIYAFSIGIYILGSLGYFVFHLTPVLDKMRAWAATVRDSVLDRHATQRAIHLAKRACRLIYTYITLLIVFPLLITLLVELYLLMPLHTYMHPTGGDTTKRLEGLREGHTIRVIQAWTLGILYLKLGSRALTLYGGRPAHAVRAILRRGWLEPDVGILTRAFVIPGMVASLLMIFMPPVVARAFLRYDFDNTEVPHEMRVLAFRLAYPLTALFWTGLFMTRSMLRVFEGWQIRIRDEAYLMGERLHNFGGGTASKVAGWRGSARL